MTELLVTHPPELSSSSHTSHSHYNVPRTVTPTPSGRRIRFAPLPDPRRAVLLTDDGNELPLLYDDYASGSTSKTSSAASSIIGERQELGGDNEILSPPDSFQTLAPAAIPASVSLAALNSGAPPFQTDSPRESLSSDRGPLLLPLSASVSASPPSSYKPLLKDKPSSWSKPKSFLRPFRGTSSAVDRPTSSSDSTFSSSSYSSAGSSSTSSDSHDWSTTHSLTPTQSIESTTTASVSGGETTPTREKNNNNRDNRFGKMNISSDQLLSLGTINLFRSSSRASSTSTAKESRKENSSSPGWGWGLQRWTSAGSANTSLSSGVPIMRTQSTQSYKGDVRAHTPKASSGSSWFGSSLTDSNGSKRRNSSGGNAVKAAGGGRRHAVSPGASPTTPTSNMNSFPRKGTRMLNGRVYGARRNQSGENPFANAKDDPDPEFVEWGYGGMGSVRSGGVWGRLQSGDGGVLKGLGGGSEGEKDKDITGGKKEGVGTVDKDEMDDGSGMGWVRRRREEREAAKKLEKEKAEAEAALAAAQTDESTVGTDTAPPTTEVPVEAAEAEAAPTPLPPVEAPIPSPEALPPPSLHAPSLGSPTPSSAYITSPTGSAHLSPGLVSPPLLSASSSFGTVTSGDEEHVLRAVTVPAPRHGHGHHRAHSHASHISHSSHTSEDPSQAEARVAESSGSSSGSSSSSDDENEEEQKRAEDREEDDDSEGDDDDEDEDEDEAGAEARKTSLGAGVEKVSRHNRG